jgi:hypothetical protein
MLRRDLLRAVMATPLTGWLRPWSPSAFGHATVDEPNAAAVYRRAFDWAKALPPGSSQQLREGLDRAIDDRHLDDLIHAARPALEAIREAKAIPDCDWGPEIVSASDLLKGRLDAVNLNIVRIACLSARRHARSGRGREALDDVFAALTLAHRIGTGGVLFARVLESAGEASAFQTLGRILPELDRANLEELSRRLEALPPPEPASATIGPESRFILGSLREKLVAAGPVIEGEGWDDFWLGEAETEALKHLTGGDRARLLAHLDATVPAFAELARRLDLSRSDCRTALDEFARTERPLHPIAVSLVENAWGARYMVDRMRALRAMLAAGLALIRNGESAFLAVADPFGNGPFALERRGNGYLIRSALSVEAKPEVSLAIGDPS